MYSARTPAFSCCVIVPTCCANSQPGYSEDAIAWCTPGNVTWLILRSHSDFLLLQTCSLLAWAAFAAPRVVSTKTAATKPAITTTVAPMVATRGQTERRF